MFESIYITIYSILLFVATACFVIWIVYYVRDCYKQWMMDAIIIELETLKWLDGDSNEQQRCYACDSCPCSRVSNDDDD